MKLSENICQHELAKLEGWEIVDNQSAIEKCFSFKDFNEAWHFMQGVSEIAEQYNHHPEWSNIYNKVHIKLTTHDAQGLTALDFKMAQAINNLF